MTKAELFVALDKIEDILVYHFNGYTNDSEQEKLLLALKVLGNIVENA